MANLLDFVIDININEALPAVNKNYIRKVAVIVKNKENIDNQFVEITSSSDISSYTDNLDCQYLFSAGMNKIYLIVWDGADADDLENLIKNNIKDFFTILVSSDAFTDTFANIVDVLQNTLNFDGVIGKTFYDNSGSTFLSNSKISIFRGLELNKASNMFFAFGKLLSNTTFKNLQYEAMPKNDGFNNGDAENLFENRYSFVLNDDTYGNRLAFFSSGGKAIVSPYIIEELKLDIQAKGLDYIYKNQPYFHIKELKLIESQLQKVIDDYINNELIIDGNVSLSLGTNKNFVATGNIEVSDPTALWRIKVDLSEV